MKAKLTADGTRFALVGHFSSQLHCVSALGGWIDFYRRLMDREGGRNAHHYEETWSELVRVKKELAAFERPRSEGPA